MPVEMKEDLKIQITADGSKTLFVESMNETYHSKYGAIAESWHVYIKEGLFYVCKQQNKPIEILEVGFGTGLNAFLSLVALGQLQEKIDVAYTTIEKYPISEEISAMLDYQNSYPNYATHFDRLHLADWGKRILIEQGFLFEKINADFLEVELPDNRFDLVYYDAFAPSKQPELWTQSIFEKVYQSMKPESILVTYSSKTQIRRALSAAGFSVSKLPGPPGKREIIRAAK